MSGPHDRLYCVMDGEGAKSVDRQPKSVRMSVYNGLCQDANSVELLVEKKNDGTALYVLKERDGKHGEEIELWRGTLQPPHSDSRSDTHPGQ